MSNNVDRMIKKTNSKFGLDYYITIEDITKDQYERLIEFVRSTIPTTDVKTPSFKPDRPMTFYFRSEDLAMAFKLAG